MRWTHHKLTSGALIYAATGNATASGLTMAGSVLPDVAEFPLRELVKHRGWSHWLHLYLVPTVVLAVAALLTRSYALSYLLFLPLGCVLHLLGDALSPGGISWGGPSSPRRGLNLYRPFGPSELLVVLGWTGVCLTVAWGRGFLAMDYLVAEGERALLLLAYFGQALLGGGPS